MLPSNEVPAINISASGAGTFYVHVVRNAAGQIASGTVDFNVNYSFPGEMEFTGLHFHRSPAGVNGGVEINTGLSGSNTIKDSTGRGSINRPAQILPTDTVGLAALRDLINEPAAFYANLHSTVNPGGVIRGQLQRAEVATYIALLSPMNEVPPIPGQNASGAVAVNVIRSFDDRGRMGSAQVIFRANYNFGRQVTMTGFHLHNGPAGVNAGVVVASGLANLPSTPTGVGSLQFSPEVDISVAANAAVVNGLFNDPAGFYANIHTTEFTGGLIRGQLRRTDDQIFNITLSPANEVPPLPIQASGPAVARVNSIRNEAGNVIAALVTFDMNYRFPEGVTFTGLHIHNQVAGQNGPVIVNTGLSAANSVVTTTGFGNIYVPVLATTEAELATVNSMMATPENHYMNLHTTINPGGVIREQVAAGYKNAPIIGDVVSGAGPGVRAVAPGGVASIYGARFAYSETHLLAWDGRTIPNAWNGVSVTIGGRAAPIIHVWADQVDVQVPYEVEAGSRAVIVKNAIGESAPFQVMVNESAPGILTGSSPTEGVVLRLADFTFISASNPANAGDVLLMLTTGMGRTTPALPTGRLVPDTPIYNTTEVSATLGGRPAPVALSIAFPGYPGYNVTSFVVIPGTPSGSQPLQLTARGQRSNTINLPVR
ncbi:MAG: CHRD domain-containing protein [Candidatus Solibacter usitatus]|nr:CHRD domain-containing protein [Candidatus Solibacter usitatus]